MEIKVLGTGCKKCSQLAEATLKAVEELNIVANIEKVEDIQRIMEYGVMTTPALIVNNEIKVKGKVPSVNEIKELLKQ